MQMRKNVVILIAIVPVLIFALIGVFARIMLMFDHNEHMYLAAALLSGQGKMQYRDFAYLQMPYLPLIYSAIYSVFQVHSSYLLVGKIASFVFTALSALAIFFVAWHTLRDAVSGLAIAALFLMNITIIGPAAEVSNYIAPVAFSLASCAVFLWALDRERPRTFGFVLAGILLALAIGTKLTYATAALPFFAVALFPARGSNFGVQLRRVFLPFALGLVLGLLPIVIFLVDFDRFLFNNLTYHNINTQWRLQTGHNEPMTLAAKLPNTLELFLRFDTLLVLAACAIGGLGTIAQAARHGRSPRWQPGAVLALVLVLVSIPTAMVPTPSFPQYFAMPVSFLYLLLVFTWQGAGRTSARNVLLTLLVLIAAFVYAPEALPLVRQLRDRQQWSGVAAQRVANDVRAIMREHGLDVAQPVATLAPLYVMEANLPIYPELATGPFLYRVGDLLTHEQRARYVGTSPATIGELFDRSPPAAILVKFESEGKLDTPLIAYATSHGYQRIGIPNSRGELYLRPPQ